MGFRFRRSIRIMPGVRLNVGKRGFSASVGVRGAHVTVSEHGTRSTVGIPGTGASWTDYRPHKVPPASAPLRRSAGLLWLIVIGLTVMIPAGILH